MSRVTCPGCKAILEESEADLPARREYRDAVIRAAFARVNPPSLLVVVLERHLRGHVLEIGARPPAPREICRALRVVEETARIESPESTEKVLTETTTERQDVAS